MAAVSSSASFSCKILDPVCVFIIPLNPHRLWVNIQSVILLLGRAPKPSLCLPALALNSAVLIALTEHPSVSRALQGLHPTPLHRRPVTGAPLYTGGAWPREAVVGQGGCRAELSGNPGLTPSHASRHSPEPGSFPSEPASHAACGPQTAQRTSL